VKPKLLVIELWGMGDLIIATPFLQAASGKFAVTLLAKPYANDLRRRFWPEVTVAPFIAPWTAFRHKYRMLRWPWRELFGLRQLARAPFDIGLSARWDPRDHFLLKLLRAEKRLGFPRLQSQIFLTHMKTGEFWRGPWNWNCRLANNFPLRRGPRAMKCSFIPVPASRFGSGRWNATLR